MSELSGQPGGVTGVDVLLDDVMQVFGTADAMHTSSPGLAELRPPVVTTPFAHLE